MGRSASRSARLRSCLVVGASIAALAVSQNAHAQAQLCPNGQPGPVCIIDNTGSSGAIVGTNGNVTVVNNTGTITGAPAISKGGSVFLLVNNEAAGVITGTAGVAIQGSPTLNYSIENAGTINGNVIVNDAPAPNPFTSGLIYYLSDGGTLNGNLQLGTTGYSTANFIQRGADDGVSGTITAGLGIDIYTYSYSTSQSLALGARPLPASFEVEGFEALGTDTTVTLTGTGTTINLSGTGSVVSNATINPLNAAGLYPPGTEVIPAAIGYYQTQVATFRRPQIAAGQPGSFFVVPFGQALTSFTNNGIVNGDVNLATASFANTGDINLVTHAPGSTIFSAANAAFEFNNTGTIDMVVNGARLPTPLGEFDDGIQAAIRLRSALDTTQATENTVRNSGTIVGGLDMRLAASDFVFENTGSIEGIDNPGGYSVPGLFINAGKLRLVAGQDPETHYDGQTASILNSATGSIDHHFEAQLSALEVTFVNNGFIAGSDTNPVALFVGQNLDEFEGAGTSFSFVNTGGTEGNVELEGQSASVSIDNSGTITGDEYTPSPTTFSEIMSGGETAFDIYNGTYFDSALTFTNSGTVATTSHAGSGVVIEVEAGNGDPDDGSAPTVGNTQVTVVNSGTISATGGATIVTQQFATHLQPGQFLANPLAALAVDATDVNGTSVVSIDNQAGGLIQAGGTVHAATPNAYFPNGAALPNALTVAVFAGGRNVNITNAGSIIGGAGTTVNPNAVFDDIDLYDGYLAGAIHTQGDEFDGDDLPYIGSIDHLTNTATGTIVGSIDLGANTDTIDNTGSITGDIYLRDGDDILSNYGSLTGNVYFGAGNDTFTHGIAATFAGTADGGEGEDRFFLDITAGGTIDNAIYDHLLSFETLSLIGEGAVDVDLGDGSDDFENTGAIEGEVDLGAGDNQFANTGTVTGNVVSGAGDDAIGNEGEIAGNVELGDGANQFANAGTVTGDVAGGTGSDNLTNDGAINGNVDLGAGANQFANAGTLTGDLHGGGDGDEVGNDGEIFGNVDLGGGTNQFANTGTVTGNVVSGAGDDAIGNEGEIAGNVALGDGANQFANSGIVTGDVAGGTGSDNLTNGGAINGNVDLGAGANQFANAGTLTGDLHGGDDGDEVDNDGEIFGNLDLGGGTNQFANTGTVTGNVAGGTGSDNLTNGGAIDGNVDLGEGTNQFANAGTVTGNVVSGAGNDAINNQGAIEGNVQLGDGANQFANTGTVTGDIAGGNGSDAVGNGGTIVGDLYLDEAAAAVAALRAGSITTQGVVVTGGNDTFNNLGTLDGSVFAGAGTDIVTNSGTVTGVVDLGDGNDELRLLGAWEIDGAATGGAGTDQLDVTFATGAANVPVLDLSGFTSFEQLEISGGTGMIAGNASFAQINLAAGRLIGDHGSQITGNVTVATGATFGSAGAVTGNIAVGNGGTLSPGASPAVMQVNGNVSLAAGSVTVFEFVPAPGQSDQLLINGNLTIASGATLNLTGSRPLTPGVAYDMIVANSISGQFTIGTWNHTAVQGFLRYLDGTSTDRLQLLGTFVTQGSASPQAARAIDYVNGLLVSGTASPALLNAVPTLLDSSGFANDQAFVQLTPEPYASATQLGVEQGLSLAKASRSGLAATNGETAGMFAFGTAYGNWRSLDADAVLGTSEAENRDYGLIAGLGYGNATVSVGGFVGYVDSRQQIAALGSETEADGILAGITGHFGSGGFGLDALIGYDWGDAETSRIVPGAEAVSSDYSLENLVLDAVASYELPLGDVALTPAIGVTHISTRRGAADETGSAAFALDVDGDKHGSTFIDGSVTISGTAANFRPWAVVGVRQQLEGELVVAGAALTGSTARFFVPGAPRDETVFTVGAGVEANVGSNISVTASYNGEFGRGHGSNAAVGIKARF